MDSPTYHIVEFLDEVTVNRFDIALAKWMQSTTRVRWCDRTYADHTFSLCTLVDNGQNCPLRKCKIRDSCYTYSGAFAILNTLRMEELNNSRYSPSHLNSSMDENLRPKKRLQLSANFNHDYDYSEGNKDHFPHAPKPQIVLTANVVRPKLMSISCPQDSDKVISEIPGSSSSSLPPPPATKLIVDLENTSAENSLKKQKPDEEICLGTVITMLRDVQQTQSQHIEILKNQSKAIGSLLSAITISNRNQDEELLPFKVPISNSKELEQVNRELAAPSVQRIFVRRIAVIGGSSFNSMIINIVHFLFTDSFAKELHGQHNGDTNSICNMHIIRQIAVALRMALKDETLDDHKVYKAMKSRINTLRAYDERKRKRKCLKEEEKNNFLFP